MCDRFKLFLISIAFLSLMGGCSPIVEPIILPKLKPDATLQETFDIKLSPLTTKIAKELNNQSYQRFVSRPGAAFSADVVSISDIRKSQFPPESSEFSYKLGVGDEIKLIQLVDSSPADGLIEQLVDSSPAEGLIEQKAPQVTKAVVTEIVSTTGRVGTDGSILLIGVGRLQAEGQTIAKLRDEVRSILIRNGKTPNFQLDISSFNSQKVFITTDHPQFGEGDRVESKFNSQSEIHVHTLTDKGTTLRELIATAGISLEESVLTTVKLQRSGRLFELTLSEVFSESAPVIFVKDQDHVFIQRLKYVSGNVYLVGGVTPKIISIKPEERQTLAEVLFAELGPLATETAQRSAVYLLRGRDPVNAYHLDTQDPTRIFIADTLELRPNDIVFVAEQPISTFSRTLNALLPFRTIRNLP